MQVRGKFALVTGAGSGIGLAIATRLLAEGAAGVSLIGTTETKLAAATVELRTTYPSADVCYIVADVAEKSQLEQAFETSAKHFGKLHIVVNNAGVVNEECPEQVAGVNLVATYRGMLLGLKYMGRDMPGGEGGAIVNVSSLLGIFPRSELAFYSATKHGVNALTRAMGNNECYSKTGVRINCICPPAVDTPMLRNSLPRWPDEVAKELVNVALRPENIADGFMKVLSDEDANGKLLKFIGMHEHAYYENKVDEML